MIVRVVAITLLVLAASLLSTAKAEEPATLRLYCLSLPGLLNDDGHSGQLDAVLKVLSQRANISFDLQPTNMGRMIRALEAGEVAAGVPQLGHMIDKRFKNRVRISPPIVYRHDYAFVPKGQKIPTSMEDLQQLVLVISPMTTLPPPLQDMEGLQIVNTPTDDAALRLLASGRAGVWVNDETTTLSAMQKAGVEEINYDPNTPFYVWPAHMVFSDTVEPDLVARINEAIMSLTQDGSLARMLPRNFGG